MGSRKKQMADAIKEAKKHIAFAKLNNCPTSPRKMRLVADLVRGEKVEHALNILKFSLFYTCIFVFCLPVCNCRQ